MTSPSRHSISNPTMYASSTALPEARTSSPVARIDGTSAQLGCALVPSILATGELVRASGNAVLDAYIVGFEIECRLGLVMNPRHYHERGWHCTSSIGTLGAAAAAARMIGLDAP